MVIIVGAGLSGLLMGYRLQQAGIPFKILESRARIGGRIHTVYGQQETPVEMGATWFGDHHTALIQLLNELKIGYFEQFMTGVSFFQPLSTSPASAITIPSQPPSYRIARGSATLINQLYQALDPTSVLLNQTVKKITFQDHTVQVTTSKTTYEGTTAVLALPPKLWAHNITLPPQLPPQVQHIAQSTQTWMESSIKIAITYAQPFWKMQGQSGTFFSNTGPIAELYDHCNEEASTFALCGFLNTSFSTIPYEDRKAQVIQQLTTVFGPSAQATKDYLEVIWSNEKETFSPSKEPLFPHQNNGHAVYQKSFYQDRLFLSSTETSSKFPGYMDGAIRSAHLVVNKLLQQFKKES
ncbi:MAG: flavin monoamine oxidase family protein [Aureispira sp.]